MYAYVNNSTSKYLTNQFQTARSKQDTRAICQALRCSPLQRCNGGLASMTAPSTCSQRTMDSACVGWLPSFCFRDRQGPRTGAATFVILGEATDRCFSAFCLLQRWPLGRHDELSKALLIHGDMMLLPGTVRESFEATLAEKPALVPKCPVKQ